MGTKFAPTYATLVLAYLEEKLYSKSEDIFGKEFAKYLKEYWKRFLDDCFIFWKRSKDDLEIFHNLLNNLHPDLKFTIESSEEKLPFLDILIKKENTKVHTDIYYKPTDTKQYLNYKSCHPKHTKNSIPYNLARRICTIVSDSKTKNERLQELQKHLEARNFPKNVIKKGILKASSIPKEQLLQQPNQDSDEIIPYVATFNPKNTEMFGNFV